jgi:F-type H+-transporting ATPase subunit b
MLIDWFTVGAQALNFLILVGLMKRYLYHPVLTAIDTREKRIAAQIADATAKEAAATKERDEFQHKNTEFDQQRAGLLSKATDEAKAERERLIEAARKDADALRAKRDELLRSDAKKLNESIAQRTQVEVFAIARKTLADLAGVSLEERAADAFATRLRALDDSAKGKLGEAIQKSAEPALIRSAFDLPPEQRAPLQQAINETFSAAVRLRFETAPTVVSGIELSAGGQKVAWSIADYLATLEKSVADLLTQPKAAEKAAEKAPEADPS